MAEFKIDGRMTVRQLKENFKNEFEGTLRVYDGREKADDNATLAAIRQNDDVKVGELVCRASRTVGKFEQEMLEVFGIKVQVASPDDWVLALDGITLANLKNIKKNATKADMEELVAYKRTSTESKTTDVATEKSEEKNVSNDNRITIKQYVKGLQYFFEEFDMDDFDGSYYTKLGTLDGLFDDEVIDETFECTSLLDENKNSIYLEDYKYLDEVNDELIEEFISDLVLTLDQGSIKELEIRDGDKVLFRESNDEPYID